MSDFWANVAANLIGTLVGAVLALLSARSVARHSERRNETRLVQAVIDRFARSRTFNRAQRERADSLSEQELGDLNRSTASVLASREFIGRVVTELTATNPSIQMLEQIYAACSLYLRSVEEHPTGYVEALLNLRDVIEVYIVDLCANDRRLMSRIPGEAAFPKAPSEP